MKGKKNVEGIIALYLEKKNQIWTQKKVKYGLIKYPWIEIKGIHDSYRLPSAENVLMRNY